MTPMKDDQSGTAIVRSLGLLFAVVTMAIRWRAWMH